MLVRRDRRTPGPARHAGAWWRGLRLTAVDGTCLDIANTPANREAFGGPEDGAFPQIRPVAHCESTRAIIAAAFDAYNTSEKALTERIGGSIFDSGFCGSDLHKQVKATGCAVIMRAGAQFNALRTVQHRPLSRPQDPRFTEWFDKGCSHTLKSVGISRLLYSSPSEGDSDRVASPNWRSSRRGAPGGQVS